MQWRDSTSGRRVSRPHWLVGGRALFLPNQKLRSGCDHAIGPQATKKHEAVRTRQNSREIDDAQTGHRLRYSCHALVDERLDMSGDSNQFTFLVGAFHVGDHSALGKVYRYDCVASFNSISEVDRMQETYFVIA